MNQLAQILKDSNCKLTQFKTVEVQFYVPITSLNSLSCVTF